MIVSKCDEVKNASQNYIQLHQMLHLFCPKYSEDINIKKEYIYSRIWEF